MGQYVLRFTDDSRQPLTDAGVVSISELFTDEPLPTSSPVDSNGFTAAFTLLAGILYRAVTSSALVPSAIFQPSASEIIEVSPTSATRGFAIVGSGTPVAPAAPVTPMSDFTYTQANAATTWTIIHNLGRYPSVTTQDTNGNEMYGEVAFLSLNTVAITFSAALAGIAYLV